MHAAADAVALGRTGLYFEHRRRFVRKSVTLAVSMLALVPVLWWKSEFAAAIYLAALVVIHVFALVVFVYRVPWRELFRHPLGLALRAVGLLAFGVLLAEVQLDPDSAWFWPALTTLWLLHVGALALLHVRHRRELRALGAEAEGRCPIPWPPQVAEKPDGRRRERPGKDPRER
ncbi:MAG TPA: hypothetical protein VHH36_00340 [Candidatus Thermoplasmatota archaeon]|nr:hypothetical protein [Candidatus Thermoplasmatota archaeon]